ncbi:MAG: amidohydrolase family protein [Sphingomonadales bacterium]
MRRIHVLLSLLLVSASTTALAEVEKFSVFRKDTTIGRVVVDTSGDTAKIEFDIKDNGRGPTVAEVLTLDAGGLPTSWKITGTQTFGGKIDESFERKGNVSIWRDSAGPGSAKGAPKLYVTQSGSPYALQIFARAILKAGGKLDVLPGGTLTMTKRDTMTLNGPSGDVNVTRYELAGLDLTPTTLLLDDANRLIALPSAGGGLTRAGFEGDNPRLRDLAAKWQGERLASIQRETAKHYPGPVRITNVRLFDPATAKLTGPVSVVVNGNTIAGVQPTDSPVTPGETVIDGAGGTLVPGMTEMHAHLSADGALLNLLAGITTVRDMGNSNPVLDALDKRIESGEVAGPRIVRSGFIEGKSPFNSTNGFVVDSEAKAVEAVRWYASRGYWQIKIYNSIDPKWVPAMVAEAHRLGLRVSGHVPAFTNADAMIAAGYDELTHINQLSLGWIIKPGEDTRTLFRLTALGRLPNLDLNSAPVQSTLDTMKAKGIALDATLGIHENLLLNRDGVVAPGAVDYITHMPIGVQRDLKQAWSNPDTFGGDANARAAYAKLVDILKRANAKGIFIVPGTDTGGSFTYHRELELYTQLGMTPGQVLARATGDMAKYLGSDQRSGSITRGKLADFFLVPGDPTKDLKAIKSIAMVAKDGVFYFPEEIYPRFGIKPFAAAPKVTAPDPKNTGTITASRDDGMRQGYSSMLDDEGLHAH